MIHAPGRRATGLALFLGLILVPAAPALAQGSPSEEERSRRDEDGLRSIQFPEDWSITEEVEQLETNMENFNGLIESLGEANQELSRDFERYLENPENEVLASDIERRMAHWAGEVVEDFDSIIANQDALISNFGLLRRKLGRFRSYLDAKMNEYDRRMADLRREAQEMDRELVRLAVRIRETSDPEEKQRLQREFTRRFRRFRLHGRHLRGYERNLRNYENLSQNLELLSGVFGSLRERFVDLIGNLENERDFLIESIRLQRDSVRVRQLIAEGFTYGEQSIRNASERLAELYSKVDAFTQVHDRINMNLGSFAQSQQALVDVSRRIDSIGMDGVATLPEVEDAVDYFAGRRDVLSESAEDYDLPDLGGMNGEGSDRSAGPEGESPQGPPAPESAPAPPSDGRERSDSGENEDQERSRPSEGEGS